MNLSAGRSARQSYCAATIIALALTIFLTACAGTPASSGDSVGAEPSASADQVAAAATSEDSPVASDSSNAPTSESGPASGPSDNEPMSSSAGSSGVTQPAPAESMPAESTPETPSLARPAWQTGTLTDLDGTSFTIEEFAGTPVFVEFFATWCPTCRSQLVDTNEAAAAAGDGAIFLALSVETELSATDVQSYRDENGFSSIRFAILTPEMLAQVVEALGNSAINPPATPHLVIAADGTTGELVTGTEDSAAILSSLGLA